jgi:hypothetical protein
MAGRPRCDRKPVYLSPRLACDRALRRIDSLRRRLVQLERLKGGIRPWREPAAVAVDQDETSKRGFLAERFRRGGEFGRVRATFENGDIVRRIIGIACIPLATLPAAWKTGRDFLYARRFTAVLATLRFQCIAQAAWCDGEGMGYASANERPSLTYLPMSGPAS